MSDLSKFEIWMLKRIFKRAVKQSYYHGDNIGMIFKFLRKAVDNQFVEDNIITLDVYMREKFDGSQK